MKEHTCCFTGHRKLPKETIAQMVKRLDQEIEKLVRQGVTDFISGGAIGFDQIATSLIVAKKEMGRDIRLIFALPCRNQDARWRVEQKRLYSNLLTQADEIICVSDEYHTGCIKKRNEFMVDSAAYCICALMYDRSGTGQTVRYTRQKGLRVINITI